MFSARVNLSDDCFRDARSREAMIDNARGALHSLRRKRSFSRVKRQNLLAQFYEMLRMTA